MTAEIRVECPRCQGDGLIVRVRPLSEPEVEDPCPSCDGEGTLDLSLILGGAA